MVDAVSCAEYTKDLGLEDFVLLGKGESQSEGRGRITILADVFEAIVGAIYIDGGMETVKAFLTENLQKYIKKLSSEPMRNFKAELQDYSQKNFHKPPEYIVFKEEGPEHKKMFYIVVMIEKKEVGKGFGSSKKEAQQNAAEDAIKKMGIK